MSEYDKDAFINPNSNTMFDSSVVEGIHKRHELRVLDVQNKVSEEFEPFKQFSKEFWKIQKFEDVVFGKFVLPFALLNQGIARTKLPSKINDFRVYGSASGELIVAINHARKGNILLNFKLEKVLIHANSFKLKVELTKFELLDCSWLMRNMIKMGLKFRNLEFQRLCKRITFMKVIKDEGENAYIIDLSDAIIGMLNDHNIDMEMIRLRTCTILKDSIKLEASIATQKLVTYLKAKMPNLFD